MIDTPQPIVGKIDMWLLLSSPSYLGLILLSRCTFLLHVELEADVTSFVFLLGAFILFTSLSYVYESQHKKICTVSFGRGVCT